MMSLRPVHVDLHDSVNGERANIKKSCGCAEFSSKHRLHPLHVVKLFLTLSVPEEGAFGVKIAAVINELQLAGSFAMCCHHASWCACRYRQYKFFLHVLFPCDLG